MGFWTLDGVLWHSQLLPFVLDEENVNETLVMIITDLSQPWNVLESLEKWTDVLKKHIESLQISNKERQKLKDNIVRSFQNYRGPEEQSAPIAIQEEEDVALPLDHNILSCNLGVPLVVVCTKSDYFIQLEKTQNYKDEHFDFIQQHIRRFCLNYGAALVYTSTKQNKNIQLLQNYLVHKAYGVKFSTPANVLEREAVFIPSGWDSQKRISFLCEQIKHINSYEPLQNIIMPSKSHVPLSSTEGVSAEDDQALLLALQAYLSKAPKTSTSAPTGTVSITPKERSPRPSLTPSAESMELSKQSTTTVGSGAGEQVLATFFNSLLTKNKGGSKAGKTSGSSVDLEKMPKAEK